MSKRFYQLVILLGALTWLSAGMRLNQVLTTLDAGGSPEANDWAVLIGTAVTGIASVLALLELVRSAGAAGVTGREAGKG